MVKELRDQGMTILYTTHYMEEAEELSDRVGIMDQGELIALGTQKELTQLVDEQETLRLHLAEESLLSANGQGSAAVAADFADLPGVVHTTTLDNEIILNVRSASEALPGAIQRANAHELRVRSVDIQEPNLEAVFLHLTGRALRD
jgi:ABC-2 type transport system ATP-binding protein